MELKCVYFELLTIQINKTLSVYLCCVEIKKYNLKLNQHGQTRNTFSNSNSIYVSFVTIYKCVTIIREIAIHRRKCPSRTHLIGHTIPIAPSINPPRTVIRFGIEELST